jgi:hypothetical protein
MKIVACKWSAPNTRVQRTRSSPSAPHSPLTRCPLGRTLGFVWLLTILMLQAAAGSAATRLIVSNDPCLIAICPSLRPPAPTSVQSGSYFTLVVLAVDDSGVPDSSYTGTVRMSSTDPLATLPADYAFTVGDAGMKAFPDTALRSPGSQRIMVSGISGEVLPGSLGLTVYQVGSCVPSTTTLCLAEARFQINARWRRSTDTNSWTAAAVSLTSDTGYFWFFDASNIEAVVKVLNGCQSGGHFWVFAGGLTDVEVTLTVVDSQTGAVQSYINPAGTAFQPLQDTIAFACP